jgi:hypothetical protein
MDNKQFAISACQNRESNWNIAAKITLPHVAKIIK